MPLAPRAGTACVNRVIVAVTTPGMPQSPQQLGQVIEVNRQKGSGSVDPGDELFNRSYGFSVTVHHTRMSSWDRIAGFLRPSVLGAPERALREP